MKIGIDLGGSHISVGIITVEGKLIKKIDENIKLINDENIEGVIRDKIISLITHILRISQIPIFVIEEIGIGIPGIVNRNIIEKCEKYGIYNWDLAKELEEYYKIPIKINNDALCAAKAELKYGNLKNSKKAVFLCFGTGIGGAITLDDNVFSSEIGHMVIKDKTKKCHCGKEGCFEQYCSMRVFKEEIVKILDLNTDTASEELLNILRNQKQNDNVNNYINSYIETLLIGISNIINIINPEKICIGGSFTYFDDILYKKLIEEYKNTKCQYKKPEIVLAKFKNEAGIIGTI